MKDGQQGVGVLAALAAYLLWGVLPLYWKWLDHVPSEEVLAHRFIWSLAFMVILLLCIGRLGSVVREIKAAFAHKKAAFGITVAAILISVNWFVFIHTVNSDRVVEASLGYYINPLVNVLLATIFLRERLSRWELLSFCLATAGVLTITVHYGSVPWAAILLALTFGFYGLMKKTVPVGAWAGLTIETLLISPFALLFLFVSGASSAGGAFFTQGPGTALLLMGAGAATATPLLLFAAGARRISFSLVGFLQYIAPTIMLVLGVFLFQEPFSHAQLVSFALIWIGLVIFTASRSRASMAKRKQQTAPAPRQASEIK